LANSSQNAANAGLRKNNTSGYKGVFLRKDCKNEKWTARIWKDNKCIWLGTFSSSKEAATAYNKAAIELFGEFACLNEIQDRQPIEI
jgi:AP2-like factor (euAP2 lineage)